MGDTTNPETDLDTPVWIYVDGDEETEPIIKTKLDFQFLTELTMQLKGVFSDWGNGVKIHISVCLKCIEDVMPNILQYKDVDSYEDILKRLIQVGLVRVVDNFVIINPEA